MVGESRNDDRGPLSGPRMSDANLGFDAALSGQGVSLVSRLLAANDLAAGRLIRLSDREVALGAYYIVTATSVRDYKSVATFTAWLKDSLTLSECDASPRRFRYRTLDALLEVSTRQWNRFLVRHSISQNPYYPQLKHYYQFYRK